MIAIFKVDDIEEGSSKGFEVNNVYMFAVKKDEQIYV